MIREGKALSRIFWIIFTLIMTWMLLCHSLGIAIVAGTGSLIIISPSSADAPGVMIDTLTPENKDKSYNS